MRVERSAQYLRKTNTDRNANATCVRHFDSRIARQIINDEPYETTLLYDVKSVCRTHRNFCFSLILVCKWSASANASARQPSHRK